MSSCELLCAVGLSGKFGLCAREQAKLGGHDNADCHCEIIAHKSQKSGMVVKFLGG